MLKSRNKTRTTLIIIIFTCGCILYSQQKKNSSNVNSCANWSTFFGGTDQDEIRGICRDGSKNIFVTGSTNSSNFPVTAGLIGDTITGDYDAFISKFDSCGNLLWSTLLGSTQFDGGEKIAVNASGEIYVCGSTFGTNFPVTGGCYQNANGGSYDAFLAKINTNGHLIWSTYFGKAQGDFAYDLALDNHQNICFGGSTNSPNLPTTSNSVQQNAGGLIDAYLASFTPAGNLRWCTYFGGSGTEDVHVMCNDKSGNIYIAGGSFSQNIVMSANAFQQFNNGGMDIYILKVDSSGNELWSTYLGDLGQDDCYALGTDSAQNLYVSGPTYSAGFPVTPGCFQSTLSQYSDIYLAKFSSGGNLMWATFLGGSDLDDCKGLVINSNQEITLLGRTESTDIPIIGTPLQSTLSGSYDLYIARCDSSGNFFWGSYLGGTTEEDEYDICLSGNNYCYLAGGSYSSDYPTVGGSYQPTMSSPEDGIISKIFVPQNPTLNISQNKKEENEIVLYPNPTKDKIFFYAEEEISSITIKDVNGKIVLAEFPGKKGTVEMKPGKLDEGIYFAEICSGKKSVVRKIVVQKE